MTIRTLIGVLVLTALAGCSQEQPPAAFDAQAHREDIEAWRQGRVESLTSDSGWLTLVGLHPLDPGENTFGAADDNDVVLPAGKVAEHVGRLRVSDGEVRLEVEPDAALTAAGEPVANMALATDAEGSPTVLEHGSLSLYVIERGGQHYLRVKDRESEARVGFSGIESYPIDARWRFNARFYEYDPIKQVPIPNVLGQINDTPSWGRIAFDVGTETFQLDALGEPGDEQLFMIIADATSGKETYGGGRYLYVDAPDADGHIVLDFNKAYNPPCVFTPYATCPLPPRQNRLPFSVEAGEKVAAAH